jgi:crossover junction endodeoxyribonuclease RusA
VTVIVRVDGNPAPQGSKRHVGHGRMVEASKRLRPWRATVAAAVKAAVGAQVPFPDGPVTVTLEFVMPRPVSTPKRSTPPAVKRPDIDKLARSCLDAITGIAISDDSQVTLLIAYKRIAEIAETPGVVIEIAQAYNHTTPPVKTPQR